MFKIDIIDNIKLSLDLTLDSFEHIEKNIEDVKSYKLSIINLHSALELTFKFMILNRNEFMFFAYGGNNFNNILKKYKTAQENEYNSLLEYLEDNPTENQPNSISFKVAYQILAYMYRIKEFDEPFIFELNAIEILRNKLTHFGATITKVDFILLNSLLGKCIELLNQEIEEYNNSIAGILNNYSAYSKYDFNKKISYNKISREIVRESVLKEPKYKLILGVILDESNKSMVNLRPDNYEEFTEIVYREREQELKDIFKNKKEKEIKTIIAQSIYILIGADLIHDGPIYYMEVDIMGRITLTDFAIEIIKEKWNNENTIYKELLMKKQRNVYDVFNDIQNIIETR